MTATAAMERGPGPVGTEAERLERAYRASRRSKRLWTLALLMVAGAVIAVSGRLGEVDLPLLLDRSDRFFTYFGRMVPKLHWATLGEDFGAWFRLGQKWSYELLVTVMIAFYATALGLIIAILGSFIAARNLAPNRWSAIIVRRGFEFARTVPELVFAVLFVFAFGIGPLAGVLAITLHAIGTLGKLFSDVNENANMEQVHAVQAAGANWLQTMRYGVLPQMAPAFLSYGLLRFEISVRAASVLGFVGAGGIGQDLFAAIKGFHYTDISAIVVMLVITVAIIDTLSEKLRHRIIGSAALRADA